MLFKKKFSKVVFDETKRGSICWNSPSNIALIKYWGKKAGNLPQNPSLSLSLNRSVTTIQLQYEYTGYHDNVAVSFQFAEPEYSEQFSARVYSYLNSLKNTLSFLHYFDVQITSENTFPHSSGIASSASAFSALALCLADADMILTNKDQIYDDNFFRKASILARIGSGSACRSVFGGFSLWGKTDLVKDSSDEYAIPFPGHIHPVFRNLEDTILILDRSPKQLSSSAGHALMKENPFKHAKYRQSRKNLKNLATVLSSGDLEKFFEIVEFEALLLHAMMLTSFPGHVLLKPHSLRAVNLIRDKRKEGLPVGFTMDAGANVHVLHPPDTSGDILEFIDNELLEVHKGDMIRDNIGEGPKKIFI